MKEYRTFYGSRSANSCAYCWKHKLALTPQQLKQRRCLARNCDALEKHEHPYWEQRTHRKEKRRARKARLEDKYKEATHAQETQST